MGLAALPHRSLPDGRRVYRAATWRSRLHGLAWLDEMPAGWALHLSPCRSIHTFGMRFALDLIWLDPDERVIEVARDIAPGRIRRCRRARSVIETRAGESGHFVDLVSMPCASGGGQRPRPGPPSS